MDFSTRTRFCQAQGAPRGASCGSRSKTRACSEETKNNGKNSSKYGEHDGHTEQMGFPMRTIPAADDDREGDS